MADYIRGEMDIAHQKATFDNVMSISVSTALLTSVVIFYLTLVFCGVTDWFTGLIASGAVGFIGGLTLKQGVLYWTSFVVFGIITVLTGLIVGLVAG